MASLVAVVAGASRGAGRGIALALGDAGAVVYVTGRTTRASLAAAAAAAGDVAGVTGGATTATTTAGGTAEPASTAAVAAADPAQRATRKGPKAEVFTKGTVDDTAEEVTARGGTGVAVACDHTNEEEVAALFARVAAEHGGRLDVVVNAVWGGNERLNAGDTWMEGFWTPGTWAWRDSMRAGPYAAYLTSRAAAPLLAANSRGAVLVHITEPAMPPSPPPDVVLKPPAPLADEEGGGGAGGGGAGGGAAGAAGAGGAGAAGAASAGGAATDMAGGGATAVAKAAAADAAAVADAAAGAPPAPPGYMANMFWDVAHATINRMAFAMACELAPKGVASVAVSPGFMRTERVMAALERNPAAAEATGTPGETPEYVGRAVVALARAMAAGGDRAAGVVAMGTSGQVQPVGRLARAYGFTDVDGTQPWWTL